MLAHSSEEIMATVEQLDAGFDEINNSVNKQDTSIQSLISVFTELSTIMDDLSNFVIKAKIFSSSIHHDTKIGQDMLLTMQNSMNNIQQSSKNAIDIIRYYKQYL